MLERVVSGETLNFPVTVATYPASAGWVLHFRLVPRVGSGSAIEFACTASGDDHLAQVSAVTTAAWTAGTYSWVSWVSKAGEVYSVNNGTVQVLANPFTASGPLDLRTDAEIALDAAKAALASWTPTTRSYTIAGRSMTFSTTAEIVPLIQYWERKVAAERRAAALAKGQPDTRRVYVRMGRG